MLILDTTGQFFDIGRNKLLGVTATKKRNRWQYRDTQTGQLYASGMTPERFVAKFWLRNDYSGTN